MHATIYGRGQMVIPAKARREARLNSGDLVSVQPDGDGRLILVRLERPAPPQPAKVRLIRRKGRHTVASTGRPVSTEEIQRLIDEFP